MKVSELAGAQLDYWVARAEGWTFGPPHKVHGWDVWRDSSGDITGTIPAQAFTPSTDWSQGGPIIERERMTFATTGTGPRGENGFEPVVAITYTGLRAMEGPTHLVAAMRAYVARKFGDEVLDEVLT